MSRFDGKAALVTGGASGIGRATTQRLVAEGGRVLGVDIDADGLGALASELGDAFVAHRADITDRDACVASVEAAIDAFGRLDVLLNVAGVARAHHLTEVTAEEWRLLWGVNVDGPFWLSQAAIPHLLEVEGNIVNIASNAGLMGQAYTVPYCATKGAVVNMTRAMAMEYVKTPLRVNAVAPGGVQTKLTDTFAIPADVDFSLMAPYTGFRGMASAEQIASVVAFVASDEAGAMTGSIVSADNGLTAG